MRYFTAKSGNTVIEKQAISGDIADIDSLIARYQQLHPTYVIEELDKAAFDAVVATPIKSKAQLDWETFKATNPTAPQGILYLAKFLGLE